MDADGVTIEMKKDDLRRMVQAVKERGRDSRRACAMGLLDGILQESQMDERTRFLLEQIKELLDD
jgi:hypothetical protein